VHDWGGAGAGLAAELYAETKKTEKSKKRTPKAITSRKQMVGGETRCWVEFQGVTPMRVELLKGKRLCDPRSYGNVPDGEKSCGDTHNKISQAGTQKEKKKEGAVERAQESTAAIA